MEENTVKITAVLTFERPDGTSTSLPIVYVMDSRYAYSHAGPLIDNIKKALAEQGLTSSYMYMS